jgi:hypothetical protein
VKRVEGITDVINNIEVLPLSRRRWDPHGSLPRRLRRPHAERALWISRFALDPYHLVL